MINVIEFELPFPPTVNTYWRRVGDKTVLSKKGKAYKHKVEAAILEQSPFVMSGRPGDANIAIELVACAPCKRKRDLDNLLKAPLDALTHAGVMDDDSQIQSLTITRGSIVRPTGMLMVKLKWYSPDKLYSKPRQDIINDYPSFD